MLLLKKFWIQKGIWHYLKCYLYLLLCFSPSWYISNWKLIMSPCFSYFGHLQHFFAVAPFISIILGSRFSSTKTDNEEKMGIAVDRKKCWKKLMRKWNNLCCSISLNFRECIFWLPKKRISSFAVDVGFLSEGNCVYNVSLYFFLAAFSLLEGSIQWKLTKIYIYWFLNKQFCLKFYRVFHGFGQAILAYDSLILG